MGPITELVLLEEKIMGFYIEKVILCTMCRIQYSNSIKMKLFDRFVYSPRDFPCIYIFQECGRPLCAVLYLSLFPLSIFQVVYTSEQEDFLS